MAIVDKFQQVCAKLLIRKIWWTLDTFFPNIDPGSLKSFHIIIQDTQRYFHDDDDC